VFDCCGTDRAEAAAAALLTATERYLHSKPRPTDAAMLTAIYAQREDAGQLALAA
jgi:hypothetical protein